VITSLGTDAPNVVGLVYIAGFGLDEGESVGALLQQGPPTPATANIDVDSEGFGWLPEDDFLGHFAADIDPVKAKVMYAVQQPLTMSAFEDVMGTPAWKSLPSWYLVAKNDEVIPPDAERQFAQRRAPTRSRSRADTWRWSPTRRRRMSGLWPRPTLPPGRSRTRATVGPIVSVIMNRE
jgi:hypothetical protein